MFLYSSLTFLKFWNQHKLVQFISASAFCFHEYYFRAYIWTIVNWKDFFIGCTAKCLLYVIIKLISWVRLLLHVSYFRQFKRIILWFCYYHKLIVFNDNSFWYDNLIKLLQSVVLMQKIKIKCNCLIFMFYKLCMNYF